MAFQTVRGQQRSDFLLEQKESLFGILRVISRNSKFGFLIRLQIISRSRTRYQTARNYPGQHDRRMGGRQRLDLVRETIIHGQMQNGRWGQCRYLPIRRSTNRRKYDFFVEPLVYNIRRRHEFLLFNETPDPQILHTTYSQLSAEMHPAQEENEFNTKFR